MAVDFLSGTGGVVSMGLFGTQVGGRTYFVFLEGEGDAGLDGEGLWLGMDKRWERRKAYDPADCEPRPR